MKVKSVSTFAAGEIDSSGYEVSDLKILVSSVKKPNFIKTPSSLRAVMKDLLIVFLETRILLDDKEDQ